MSGDCLPGAMMVLALKLISAGVSYQDGRKKDEVWRMPCMPSYFPEMSHITCLAVTACSQVLAAGKQQQENRLILTVTGWPTVFSVDSCDGQSWAMTEERQSA